MKTWFIALSVGWLVWLFTMATNQVGKHVAEHSIGALDILSYVLVIGTTWTLGYMLGYFGGKSNER